MDGEQAESFQITRTRVFDGRPSHERPRLRISFFGLWPITTTNMSTDDRARLEKLRRDLAQHIPKKRAVDRQLAQIEAQLYGLEGSYITETAQHNGGNLIHGFDNYLKGPPANKRRADVNDQDRLFSNSSMTWQKVCLLGPLQAREAYSNAPYH